MRCFWRPPAICLGEYARWSLAQPSLALTVVLTISWLRFAYTRCQLEQQLLELNVFDYSNCQHNWLFVDLEVPSLWMCGIWMCIFMSPYSLITMTLFSVQQTGLSIINPIIGRGLFMSWPPQQRVWLCGIVVGCWTCKSHKFKSQLLCCWVQPYAS